MLVCTCVCMRVCAIAQCLFLHQCAEKESIPVRRLVPCGCAAERWPISTLAQPWACMRLWTAAHCSLLYVSAEGERKPRALAERQEKDHGIVSN